MGSKDLTWVANPFAGAAGVAGDEPEPSPVVQQWWIPARCTGDLPTWTQILHSMSQTSRRWWPAVGSTGGDWRRCSAMKKKIPQLGHARATPFLHRSTRKFVEVLKSMRKEDPTALIKI